MASLALDKTVKLFSVTCGLVAFITSIRLPGPLHPGLHDYPVVGKVEVPMARVLT